MTKQPHPGVHDWSLHRALGGYVADGAFPWDATMAPHDASTGLSLLELPAALREHDFDTVQLCHFHLPSRDATYLAELRASLSDTGVRLETLLVDTGDLTHPTEADRHERWIRDWVDTASTLGAERTRVIAGRRQPTPETLDESARRLRRIAAGHTSMRIVTENWFELLPTSTEVLALLDRTGDEVGLLLDLANWSGPGKYDELAAVAHLAESCHAKANLGDDGRSIDRSDFRRSLEILHDAGFTGTYALVFDGSDRDDWDGLAEELEVLLDVIGTT